jgi:hypothetical protein
MGRLDDIDGLIAPHKRAGRFRSSIVPLNRLATTIALTNLLKNAQAIKEPADKGMAPDLANVREKNQ